MRSSAGCCWHRTGRLAGGGGRIDACFAAACLCLTCTFGADAPDSIAPHCAGGMPSISTSTVSGSGGACTEIVVDGVAYR